MDLTVAVHALYKGLDQAVQGLLVPGRVRPAIDPGCDLAWPLHDYHLGGSPRRYGNRFDFDEKGVLVFFINKGDRWIYAPTLIFNEAGGMLARWLDQGDEAALRGFRTQMDWACENQVKAGGQRGAWVHHVRRYSAFTFKPPWVNASAQGKGVSLLLRAWILTGEERYREAALMALGPFERDVAEGGVRLHLDDGRVFYETYPSTPPSLLINGFIRALLGFRDVSVFTGDAAAGRVWSEGVETVRAILPRYDTGFWTRYDLREGTFHVHSKSYHDLTINNMILLHRLTGDPFFRDYADRFTGYTQSRWCYFRALACKAAWRATRLNLNADVA
ncbi:MAG TPA: D-glucuronyl C5-epimerase family protein [Longimicrobium sp.]|nr:D-glucuronyl C5-epimerase family protein [Longimicrobium sp.]